MQFLFAPLIGGLSDKYGRRPVLLFSLFGFGIDYLFLALAPTYSLLFVGRIIAGITGASFSVANAYLADITPPEQRAKNFGLIGAAFGLGFIFGPMLGGLLGAIDLHLPFYVAAGRTTFNSSAGNNGVQLVGIDMDTLKKNVGLFKTPGGIFFINPNLLDLTIVNGKVTKSTIKAGLLTAPAPGTFGNFPVNSLSGPKYFNFDLSITKRIPITERVRFELKGTAINVLNHPNFIYGTQNFDSTTFGLITTQRGNARQMNIIAQMRF